MYKKEEKKKNCEISSGGNYICIGEETTTMMRTTRAIDFLSFVAVNTVVEMG